MLMKYAFCVLLLMESKFINSLADNLQKTSELDCDESASTFFHSESCCHYSSAIPLIKCANLKAFNINITEAHLILINSSLKLEAALISQLRKFTIISSEIIIGDDKMCYDSEELKSEVSSNIEVLEVISSTFLHMNKLNFPKLVNFTISNSSISANILDLSWTMESSNVQSVSVITSNVTRKPCPVQCVAKRFKEYQKPKSLQFVSFRGTEFRCLYIATAETQWFRELRPFMDQKDMYCTAELAEYGNSSYFEISKVSEVFRSMTRDCPTECCCWYSRMAYNNDGRDFDYTVQVDCSKRNLTRIPSRLPKYVSYLDISHNKIDSLKDISEGKQTFERLHSLLASNNSLQSIKDLEGSKFSTQFTQLNISLNFIPIDESLMAFVKTRQTTNDYGSGIWIANRPNMIEECTCHMAKAVRPWLWDHSTTIKDHRRIYCLNNTRYGTKHVKLLFLYEESICPTNDPSDFNWDALIVVQSFMIALPLFKLFYDFWVYNRTSELPWIALKLF